MLARWLWCVWLVFAVACVHDDLVRCDDGTACPTGMACHPTGCVVQAQIAACAGKADLEACVTAAVAEGVCGEGACFAAGCGNAVLEPARGERCDDGNTTDLDGCSANCRSEEACGNGVIDELRGEACDDGNTISGDGCQGNCALPRCGDGVEDTGEACDDGAGNSDSTPDACRTSCQRADCGDQVVDAGEMCDDGNSTNNDACRNDCTLPSCGNGTVELNLMEECDDGNLNAGDACQPNCKLPRCGDGYRDANEACDEGDGVNAATPDATCRPGCVLPRCGDGVTDVLRGEACDDANLLTGDGCRPNCTRELCGDGVIDPAGARTAEQCDDGTDTSAPSFNSDTMPDACRTDCTRPACGDGVADPGRDEQCDLGAQNSNAANAACRLDCRSRRCGDSIVDGMFEACDDGNLFVGDGCRPDCKAEVCGDGIIDLNVANPALSEQCDSGANNSDVAANACRTTCRLPRCGDGVTDGGEDCDSGAGNANAPNACRPTCRAPRCGDNIIDAGEQCDGTNRPLGFPCSASCQYQRCGNGTVDPGEACDDGNAVDGDLCRNNCTRPLCGDGITDLVLFEQCDLGTGNNNRPNTCRTNCRLPFCGDGIADVPSEICDDGNTQAGDGCTPDCQSNETCGNGRIDFAKGEECDDGNVRSHDTCSSGCLNELPRWTDVTPSTPPARAHHAAVYDAARRRIVMFGGEAAPDPDPSAPVVLLGDTWEHDGAAWVQRRPTAAPSARKDHALVYDSQRGLVYLFGGINASGARLNDLWVWNGTTWSQVLVTSQQPVARSEAAVVYDPGGARIIVFGGRTATGYLNDTWAFTGGSWANLGISGPSARSGAAAALDPALGRLVVVGGETGPGVASTETWILREGAWTVGPPIGRPVRGARLAWDPDEQALFLTGGVEAPGGTRSGLVWRFDGSSWTTPDIDGGPDPLDQHTLTLLPDGGLLLVGGQAADGLNPADWVLARGRWELAPASPSPSRRVGAGVAYDPLRGVAVMHGGIGPSVGAPGAVAMRETWEWAGLSWRLAAAGSGPPATYRPAMAFHERARQLLLTGGSVTSSCAASVERTTWAWDGRDWVRLLENGPGRCDPAVAYHRERGEIVHIGGYGAGQISSTEAHTWNSGWAAAPVYDGEAQVSGRSVVYDHTVNELWRVGGFEEALPTKLVNAWARWRGGWVKVTDEIAPPPRKRSALVYDPNRLGVTLFGGEGLSGPLDDVWFTRADSRWSQVPTSLPVGYVPEPPAIVYHDVSASFVAVAAPSPAAGTTYTLRYESRTPDEACWLSIDRDGDGKPGLDDPDCWPYVNALCPPCPTTTSCACPEATCRDGVCSSLERVARSCADDCGDPDVRCGDLVCDAGEACPGDCP